MDETFHWYYHDSPIEDVARYSPGGYHPVKLGDCFSTLPTTATPSSSNLCSSTLPRYRILHKLGHGTFATVWLARDLLPPRCVYYYRIQFSLGTWTSFLAALLLSRSRSQTFRLATTRLVYSNSSQMIVVSILKGRSMY